MNSRSDTAFLRLRPLTSKLLGWSHLRTLATKLLILTGGLLGGSLAASTTSTTRPKSPKPATHPNPSPILTGQGPRQVNYYRVEPGKIFVARW